MTQMTLRFSVCTLALAVAVPLAPAARAAEISFAETFALATDREAALKQLIPGSEDFYYYSCLHYQNTEQWEQVPPLLKAWIERYHHTPRVIEIENRQALLRYDKDSQAALELIRRRLSLHFHHQREELNKKPNLPTTLDANLLDHQRLVQQAFGRHPNTVSGFEDSALGELMSGQLTGEQRRHLLSRVQVPDHPSLAKLVVADLNFVHGGGFGSLEIHKRLLLAQLDECLKLKPGLRNDQNFVATYLQRLWPSNDTNWRQDKAAEEAYLDRLWAFVETLAPVHNSLKAHVVYHRLVLDRSRGVYDAGRFLTYLKLPRHTRYAEPKFFEIEAHRSHPANLQQDFQAATLLATIGDDEPLVRSYLDHFFAQAADYDAYKPYILSDYLKHTFAEAKVVRGLGDPETWYSLLPPEQYQAIKDRIDLDFALTNKTEFGVDDTVKLDLDIKHVETLIVKVFEINTQNFYREKLTEVGPNIDLDGLVANDEQTFTYQEAPVRRVRRQFEFPKLNARGVYVIDFIGNGKSSRAVIKKGRLRYLVRSSVAGQIFQVYDELNQPVTAASLWLAGNLYAADKEGRIVAPYSNQPGSQPIVLSAGSFSTLEKFEQHQEQYQLQASFHVDREQLLSLRPATLLVRPQLMLGNTPVTPKVLTDIQLVIASVDSDNVSTVKEVKDFKIFEDRESVYEFQTPKRLRTIQFTLKARVKNQSQNEEQDLSASEQFTLNQIDQEDKTEDLHFTRNGDVYVVDLLGKSGEAKPDRAVHFTVKLRGFTDPLHVSLQTDPRGRITLGPLPGVDSLTATSPQGTQHQWQLADAAHTYPGSVHGVAGEPLEVPYCGSGKKVDRSDVALLEMRGTNFYANRLENLSVDGGLYVATKLPAGDYRLWIKAENRFIDLRLTEGVERPGYVLGGYRRLQVVNPKPLAIKPVTVGDKTIRIDLQNATAAARVHVFVTRFEPAYSAYGDLSGVTPPEPFFITNDSPISQYEAGRDIGDELRYIIDRKFSKTFPGNMLDRPSLLLNPWAVRKTETDVSEAEGGEAFGMGAVGGNAAGGMGGRAVAEPHIQAGFTNLDFLANSSALLVNIAPDEQGVIEIKREELGPRHRITILAVDGQNTASRYVDLPEPQAEYLDLRLAKGLDPKVHFTQQQRITLVAAGKELVIPDLTSTRFEVYDSLPRVFSLYATLGSDAAKLREFAPVVRWPTLTAEEKTELYKKCASHELHFFLFKKDPEFFNTAVKPYLANKKEKQLIDRWLLGENLDVYAQPWKFEQLNAFERILLGLRLQGERESVARLVREQFDLLPPDRARFELLFNTAVKGTALDIGDALGLEAAKEKLDSPLTMKAGHALSGERAGAFHATSAATAAPPASPVPAEEAMADLAAESREAPARQESSARSLRRGRDKGEAKKAMSEATLDEADAFADDRELQDRVEQYYRTLDKTMEWAESNYFQVPSQEQHATLVSVSAFWRDFATHDQAKPFVSTNMAEASRNLPEMLAALALLDLPFEAGKHTTEFDGSRMTFTAKSPSIVFHEEIQKATSVADTTPILVSQNFYRHGERYRQEGSEQLDKFVTDEFLVHTVYGSHIVVTNPTSSRKKVDVLLQIPEGAIPVLNGQNTKSVHVTLEPYHTQTVEYFFYFPAPGTFRHYPVQVATDGDVLAFANAFVFNVVPALTKIDKASWDYISQYGTTDDVLTFLKANNVLRVDLARIAWRMKDKAFFNTVTGLLAARHIYHDVLWSYGVLHDEPAAIREFLQFSTAFVGQCGAWIKSPLLVIDPIVRKDYESLDYRPLVNARVGQLGRQREILNDRFHAQYERLMKILTYRRQFTSDESMAVTAYLLLQDRVEESLASFARVNSADLETRLQYDYFSAYLDFYSGEPKAAKTTAEKYATYPIERWKLAFASVVSQASEIEAEAISAAQAVRVIDPKNRDQIQTSQAAKAPAFEFTAESKKVRITHQNLAEVRVNYYLMDIELLFSRNPFVQHDSKQFSHIVPNLSQTVALAPTKPATEFSLPDSLVNANVLIEITGGGLTRSQAYYSGALRATLSENYGQVRVTRDRDGSALPKVYVKVYARMSDGHTKFFKDGYTDLRGRFDYTSLSTDELDRVDRFSLLILSDDHGAVVREAPPPKQ